MIRRWRRNLLSFWNTRILFLFLLGFSSGIPFLLVLSTLSVRLKEEGISHTLIGLFVLVTLPYTLKFLWGPFVDTYSLPYLSKSLGRRLSWALLAQMGLMITLIGLGQVCPNIHLVHTALWALLVCLFSALQDVSLEAYRIEIAADNEQAAAATAMTLGWQLGMMTAGAGSLLLASFFSWQTAYNAMAGMMLLGIAAVFFSPPLPVTLSTASTPLEKGQFFLWLKSIQWPLIFLFIFFFKIGDTILSVMNAPFLLDLHFTKIEIAHTTKIFGVIALIIGSMSGGIFLNRFGLSPALLLTVGLQMCANILFGLQALIGHHLGFLILAVGVENLSSGFGATAFVVFLSTFCKPPYTATHFAFLASLGSFIRIILSPLAGFCADFLPWPLFFGLTALSCLPCFVFLLKGRLFRFKSQLALN